jgi:glycosyltransferase involved in cell wall biosynthesis
MVKKMVGTKVSVITIVKNDVEGFRVTTKSILEQNYSNLEWVVIDGLSTDGTIDCIRSLAHRISKLKIEEDSGIYNAMNKGIDMVTGDWVFFMNAGDVFFEANTITKYVESLTKSDDIVFSDAVRKEDGQVFFYKPANQFWAGMICDHQTICTRAEIYKKLKFDESYKIAGDFDFISRAWLLGCNFRKIPFLRGVIKPFSVGVSANYAERQIERIRVIIKYFNHRLWLPLLFKEFCEAYRMNVLEKEKFTALMKLLKEKSKM